MNHPQPALDFLLSLPGKAPADESVLIDWYAYSDIDAEKGDDIVENPEVWEKIELPSTLAELTADDYATIQQFEGTLNLNAMAIGLSLDELQYEPEVFGGIVYRPTEYEATAIIYPRNVFIGIGETPEAASKIVGHCVERLEQLGLDEDLELSTEKQTAQVSKFL